MRTKTLLLSAAAMAAGLISSMAQGTSNVYSANVVGYATLHLTNGFTMFGNQLDVDGTGTNNTILTVLGTNFPSQTKVLAWNTNTATYATITLSASQVWSSGAAGPIVKQALQPGGGVFISIPGATPTNIDVAIVGNVLQESNRTPVIAGFQIVSYPFPISGGITTNFNYIPNPSVGSSHDKVLTWSVASQTFVTHQWGTTSWTAGDPQLSVLNACFLSPIAPNVWTNQFFVQ